jgi:hypothetical protein
MNNDSTVRAMDTASGADLAVTTSTTASGEHVVLLQDVTMFPGHAITLTHREAHQLAVMLLEQSAEAESREIDRQAPIDVAMVCIACRKLAVRTRHDDGWQHADVQDSLACPRLGSPVTVMVAAGNENIPVEVS